MPTGRAVTSMVCVQLRACARTTNARCMRAPRRTEAASALTMHTLRGAVLILYVCVQATDAQGSMHPQIGFPPNCNLSVAFSCAPTYERLAQGSALWPCPKAARTAASTWPAQCVAGQGGANPLCPGELTEASPCCCPSDGCYAEPNFNTVIGVCRGASCACGGSATRAPSCAPEGAPYRCGQQLAGGGAACTGDSVPCCFGNDVTRLVPFYDAGTRAKINYLAAYQFDADAQVWRQQRGSSFNTNGSLPTFDLMRPYGGLSKEEAWLAPQPGGAAFWSLGYYAAGGGATGVGPPGALFVLSTEEWWGGTWYALNQLELERGPARPYDPQSACPTTANNCWAAGNAGEMDFLEPAWDAGRATDASVRSAYRASYSTQSNQVGRQFVGGVNTGGFASPNYLYTAARDAFAGSDSAEPIVYVAVIDSVGSWVYRLPADDASTIWPGIGRKRIEPSLQRAPSRRPEAVNPCLTGYCVVFTSNCQATNVSAARAQGCVFNNEQGFCGNWFARFADTRQPLVPSETCERDVRGGVQMPWCVEMVPSADAKGAPRGDVPDRSRRAKDARLKGERADRRSQQGAANIWLRSGSGSGVG